MAYKTYVLICNWKESRKLSKKFLKRYLNILSNKEEYYLNYTCFQMQWSQISLYSVNICLKEYWIWLVLVPEWIKCTNYHKIVSFLSIYGIIKFKRVWGRQLCIRKQNWHHLGRKVSPVHRGRELRNVKKFTLHNWDRWQGLKKRGGGECLLKWRAQTLIISGKKCLEIFKWNYL